MTEQPAEGRRGRALEIIVAGVIMLLLVGLIFLAYLHCRATLVPLAARGDYPALIGALDRLMALVVVAGLTILAGGGLVLAHFRSRAASLLRAQAERLRLAGRVFADSEQGIIITDDRARILDVNRAFTRLTGYAREEAIGQTPHLLSSGRHDPAFFAQLWQSVERTGRWQGEIWNRRKDREIYPEWLSISAVRDADGRICHYIGIFSDLTEHKRSQERIHYLAHYDPLTGLPNRLLLTDRLSQELAHARREGNGVALLLLDLDRFKPVNETLGHPAGDRLLVAVATRLREGLREPDTLARLGGDEFAIVVSDGLDDPGQAPVVITRLVQRLMERLRRPFFLDEQEVFTTASIGIALYPQDGERETQLLANADSAMYQAKQRGRNGFQFYCTTFNDTGQRRLALSNALHQALERQELTLVYQPQVDLFDERIVGAEVLLRWEHPLLGQIGPADFIPLAEELGLIDGIGRWVLESACAQLVAWRRAGLDLPRVAVNLSARQFLTPELPEVVEQVMARHGMDPDWLELEITEGLLVDDSDRTLATLIDLRSQVGSLSIDDFGTGYSSLSYLRRLPVDTLKIDQAFVREMTDARGDEAIVDAILGLARSLGLEVIAEGVETRQQAELLRAQGCRYAQGYLFGRPMTADQLARLLEGQSVRAATG